MIYKTLWIANLLLGIANGLLFLFTANLPAGIAAVICGLACWITFDQAWEKEKK
jgi:hypothetical protein